MLIQIPFSGFYETLHDSEIDSVIFNSLFTDRATGCNNNDGLSQSCFDHCNFAAVFKDYAREYCENFAQEFDIKLTFESLQSPKEYNFSTDRIFAEIDENEVKRMFDNVKPELLEKTARAMFTSCSGFFSFYDPDYKNWPALANWDHNQLLCLLTAFLELDNESFDHYKEFALMENSFSNGFLTDSVLLHTSNSNRLMDIWDYLENRKERAESRKAA